MSPRSVALLLAAVVSLPSLALAQVTVEGTITNLPSGVGAATDAVGTYTVNIDGCRKLANFDDALVFEWTVSDEPASNSEYSIKRVRAGEDCTLNQIGPEDDDECVMVRNSQALTESTIRVEETPLTMLQIASADECANLHSSTVESKMVLVYNEPHDLAGGEGTDASIDNIEVVLLLDLARPASPEGGTVSAGETSVSVTWTESEVESDTYQVYYSTNEADFAVDPEEWAGTTPVASLDNAVTIDGLTVDRTYYVSITTIDDADNESAFAPILEVGTVPSTDFWELYRDGGGAEEGGYCAVAPSPSGSSAALLGVVMVGIALLRRREEVGHE